MKLNVPKPDELINKSSTGIVYGVHWRSVANYKHTAGPFVSENEATEWLKDWLALVDDDTMPIYDKEKVAALLSSQDARNELEAFLLNDYHDALIAYDMLTPDRGFVYRTIDSVFDHAFKGTELNW